MIPIRYNLRSVIVRRVGTLMTVLGVGLTVAVFVSILAMVQGLQSTFTETGEPLNLIVIRQGSQSETNSFFDRDRKGIIETMEGVESVAGEIVVVINRPRVGGDTTNVMVRGVSDKTSMELRPAIKIVEGRMFKPGLRELVVSRPVSQRFKDAKIGDSMKIGRSTWNIVGVLDASQTAQDSEIWGDYNEIAQEFERPIYSSLLIRVKDMPALKAVKDRIAGDRRVKLDTFTEKEYFATQTSSAVPLQVLGYLVAIIMAIGSCFAVMNTMYAATAYRTREIATLRVLGYRRFSILLSFVFESILLAVCGGILGCLLALPMNGMTTGMTNFASFSEVVFKFRVTTGLMLEGVIFAAIMGGIGGFLPGVRAAFLHRPRIEDRSLAMDEMSTELNKLRIDKSKRSESKEGNGKGKWIVLLLLILIIGGSIGSYAYLNRKQSIMVDVVRPRLESTLDSAVLVASGYVVAHHKIQVGSKISGRVAWIGVEKGDHVNKDQLVVRLEDREYRAQYEQAMASFDSTIARLAELEKGSRPEEIDRAKADMERADAQLRADEANFKRVENMVKQGVGAAQMLDEAKGRYDTSRAAVASATKTFELARLGPRKEQIDNARSEVSRAKAVADYSKSILDATEIRVPTAGTILERNVEQGEMVTTSFVGAEGAKGFVVTLADLNDIQVELDIDQNSFNRIAPNQPCTVVSDAYPDRVYKCRVAEIAPEANRQKATVQVKVQFLAPDNFVKPEMNARVTFLTAQAEKAKSPDAGEKLFVIPRNAIQERTDGNVVFVLANDVVQSRPVTVAREVGTDAYVSAGLTGNESIIVGESLKQVKVGDHVEVRK